LAFLSFWYRKKGLHMPFNRYSVMTQFEKFAAREQLCRRRADKSLARPGRKQTTATEDFDVQISYLLSQLEKY
jgi:hypothetical protein